MPNQKQPHGSTFQQGIILAILGKYGPLTSSEIASYYDRLAKARIAYNYQFIVTRRMAEGGLIRSGHVKNTKGQRIYRWTLTPKGRKLLAGIRQLNRAFARI